MDQWQGILFWLALMSLMELRIWVARYHARASLRDIQDHIREMKADLGHALNHTHSIPARQRPVVIHPGPVEEHASHFLMNRDGRIDMEDPI
jgi:hypothetical protein